MAAFDRVKSGIPEMDKALDNIRLGTTSYGAFPTLPSSGFSWSRMSDRLLRISVI